MKSIAIAFLCACLLAPAAQAAELKAPPFWSSDQVRAARSLDPEPALIFDVRDVDGSAPAKDQTVTLAASFTAAIGGESSLEDWTLCRAFTWSPGAKAMTSMSCFAWPAFRVWEIANRTGLNQITKSDLYWDEVELGIQREKVDRLQKSGQGSDIEYRHGDKVVIRISGALAQLSPEEAHRLERFIAGHIHLHPQARHDLEQLRVLPAKIEIQVAIPSRSAPHQETLTFSNIRRAPEPYPLPAGLASDIERAKWADTPAAGRGIHEAVLAAQRKSAIPRPTLSELVSSMTAAANAHHGMEALMRFLELTQLYAGQLQSSEGAGALAQLKAVLPGVVEDPEAKPYWAASSLAGDASAAGDREAAARYLAGAQVDKLPFGTFRYVTFANLVRGSKGTDKWDKAIFKAMPNPLTDGYWIHIAAFPWSANAYKDLGDTYLEGFDSFHAWLAYDLGRAADENWKSSVMNSVDDLENRMKAGLPDYF
jgi:hypothetical protein